MEYIVRIYRMLSECRKRLTTPGEGVGQGSKSSHTRRQQNCLRSQVLPPNTYLTDTKERGEQVKVNMLDVVTGELTSIYMRKNKAAIPREVRVPLLSSGA